MSQTRGLEQLNRRVVSVINQLTIKLAKTVGIVPSEIYQAAVVGNTTMSHLFLGLDPTSPFIPVVSHLIEAEAKELGLDLLPQAPAFDSSG